MMWSALSMNYKVVLSATKPGGRYKQVMLGFVTTLLNPTKTRLIRAGLIVTVVKAFLV
jgi:hypothetical protein